MGGRDLVREFVDACRKYDMRIGLYYSPPDWYFDVPYRNWDASGRSILDTWHKQIKTLPKKPAGHDEKCKEMVRNQVRKLLTNYGKIDIMWFDGGHGEISNDEVRRLQPGIIVNRRNGELGDFGDSKGFFQLNVLQVGLNATTHVGPAVGGDIPLAIGWIRVVT